MQILDMGAYPLVVDLADRPCVVVGGGTVAERKVGGLLAAKARVTVVSPVLTDGLTALARRARILHVARRYRPGDLAGATLAFEATGDRRVGEAVAREGRRRRVWVNAADDRPNCDFFVPSMVRRGPLLVAVATGGASPALARAVREKIERLLPDDVAMLADTVAEVRSELRGRGASVDAAVWNRVLSDELGAPGERRSGRARSRLLGALTGGPTGPVSASRPRRQEVASRPVVLPVAIVGAGPGDPGLITIRGLELLRRADVVVHDRLVSPKLLDEAPPGARRVFVGKACGVHALPQHEINRLLIAQARRGQRVVRLKGGDPFVFGRGGEEAAALGEAGIAVEIVPGVTSAVAVPAAAGIPLTHRGVASSFAVVTGHRQTEAGAAAMSWAGLAGAVDTLVILMGLSRLPEITCTLIAHGRPPDTPAALIERGTTEAQRTVIATVGTLAEAAAEARLESPVVIVVGDVVSLRDEIQ